MPAKLNIPERYRAGVSKIRRLDDRTVQEIKKALDQAGNESASKNSAGVEASRDPDDIAIAAMRSVASVNTAEFAQIAESLAGLYTARSMRDVPTEEFLDSVCDAMEALPQDELRLPHAEREQFKNKLRPLLSSEFFSIVAKAYDLVTEERTFCSARILTDLRPVFSARVEDGPQAMVVMHTLKLVYHEGSRRHEEFFVALDAEDLRTLRKVVDRAEAKAEALRPALKDMRLFGLPRE
jgi:hypothetical protein